MKDSTDYRDYKLEKLKDPKLARLYLETAAEDFDEDGNRDALLLAIRDVAEAQGGMNKLAKATKLNRQNLYKAFSVDGNPTIGTFDLVLKALGFKLSIKPIQ